MTIDVPALPDAAHHAVSRQYCGPIFTADQMLDHAREAVRLYIAGRVGERELRDAAQAVIDRWDTPLWKDVPATAEFINALRAALAVTPATEGAKP